MYRIVATLTYAGRTYHVLKAETGYYGWGYEVVNPDGSQGKSCVQYDTRDDAERGACEQLDAETEPVVCGGTGNHDGQSVDTCDECTPTLPDWVRARFSVAPNPGSAGGFIVMDGATPVSDCPHPSRASANAVARDCQARRDAYAADLLRRLAAETVETLDAGTIPTPVAA